VLAAKSTTVSEIVFVYDIVPHGVTVPIGLGLVVTCGADCAGDVMLPVALAAGASYSHTLHFVNSIMPNAVRFNFPTYNWELTGGSGYTRSGRRWRCDSTFVRQQRAGCVYAAFVPTVSMAGLKFITPSIRNIQAHGGPTRLHRNNFLTTPNRNAVCLGVPGPNWKPPAGWPLPVSKPGNEPQCDEYPFAGTWEGGTRLPKGQRGVEVVPASENYSQGGRLTAFYLANRVINAPTDKNRGDAFNVTA
jgi:hypothetical protein